MTKRKILPLKQNLTCANYGVYISLEYYRGSGRLASNAVTHVKLRKRKTARFELFSSLFFVCDL